MKSVSIKLLFIFCLVFAAGASASEFYKAKVVVKSQSRSERSQAAAKGLEIVIFRLTGIRDYAEHPAISTAKKSAVDYVDQFHYEQREKRGGDGKSETIIVFQYSSKLIDSLITQRANLPYWPLNRPQVLVWLVEDNEESGRILLNDPNSEIYLGLMDAAKLCGLPLRLPLLDLEDQLALPPDRAWLMDEQAIMDASARYGVDTVLVGRYSQTSRGEWLSSWQYFHREQSDVFDQRAEKQENLGEGAVNLLAGYLRDRYSVRKNDDNSPLLTVELLNINNFAQYSKVLNYLEGLAVVSTFSLSRGERRCFIYTSKSCWRV